MDNQNNKQQQKPAAKPGFNLRGIQGPVMANGPLSLNLLPDVKKQLIKIKRERSTVIAVSMVAVAASAAILVIMSMGLASMKMIEVGRRNSIKSSNSEIQEMKKKNQLDKYLTIQNQLGQITSLKDSQQAYSRLLGYLTSLNPSSPNNVYLNDISVTDGSDGSDTTGASESGAISMTLQGRVQDFPALNVYKNTLMQAKIKYTERTDEDDEADNDSSANDTSEKGDGTSDKDSDSKKATRKNLFSSVVVSESGMSSGSSSDDGGVSFTIQLVFCPEAFSSDVTTPEVEIPKTLTSNGTEEAPDDDNTASGTNPNNSDSTNANETFHTDATDLNNNNSNAGVQNGGSNE